MKTKHWCQVGTGIWAVMLSLFAPGLAAAQPTAIDLSVYGAAGTHIVDDGNHQSVGLAVMFGGRFGVVVNAERSHTPSDVTYFQDGYSASRGATTLFVSAEFRYVPVTFKRLSPHVIVGAGIGESRPNVNEIFPNRVRHTVNLVFPGAGASVRLTEHLSAFADVRFMLQSRRGEPDAGGFAPVRAGIAWRF